MPCIHWCYAPGSNHEVTRMGQEGISAKSKRKKWFHDDKKFYSTVRSQEFQAKWDNICHNQNHYWHRHCAMAPLSWCVKMAAVRIWKWDPIVPCAELAVQGCQTSFEKKSQTMSRKKPNGVKKAKLLKTMKFLPFPCVAMLCPRWSTKHCDRLCSQQSEIHPLSVHHIIFAAWSLIL